LPYHAFVHFMIVLGISQLKPVDVTVNVGTKVSDVRMTGMGYEPERDVAGKIQFHQMEQPLINIQEYSVYLLTRDNNDLVVEMVMNDVFHFVGIGVCIVLRDGNSIQPLILDGSNNPSHDIRGRIGAACGLTTVSM
jgi:hypothetical protein